MGADDCTGSCLFEAVVKMRRLLTLGMRSNIRSRSCEMVIEEETGSESVDGRFSPGKEVRRTFIVGEAMVVVCTWASSGRM